MVSHPAPTAAAEPDPPTASAEDLLERCAQGDRGAFVDLYLRLSPGAYGLALRVLRDEHLAQDALQEAFEQIWSQSGRYDRSRSSARSWILTIVHRRAVDRVRREQVERQGAMAWGAQHREAEHDVVAEVVELHADHRRVRAALSALTPLQRQALELAYHRGLTQTQVAAELGIPLGTAKTRLRDATRRLRDELEGTR